METEEIEQSEDSQVTTEEGTETSEPKVQLVWSRGESDEVGSAFKERGHVLRKLFRVFFILDNTALNWSGYCPNFEKSVLFDKCKNFTFTFSRLFLERQYRETRPLNSSIRAKRLNRQKSSG